MNKSVQADLVSFLKHLTAAFKPIAKAEGITLSFTSVQPRTIAFFQPLNLVVDIGAILTKIIELTPERETIVVSILPNDTKTCYVSIINSGINLSLQVEVTRACKSHVAVSPTATGTQYQIEIELVKPYPASRETQLPDQAVYPPDEYDDIRKRLRSHFTRSADLLELLAQSNPRDAAFLRKVNNLIIANLQNPKLDTHFLSECMSMSRTQLFRRLKPIIKESAGDYIRTLRLQKAKELLESTDLRINEVAYQTGFETASHFTRAFTQRFGINPSSFLKKEKQQRDNKMQQTGT